MRKPMKRLISLVVCFVFLMTLAPIAMAAGDEADIAELNIEDILNHQPANMVTEALNLSADYTWTASPEGVVNTATGAVTRHAIEDKTVTLTATKDSISESFTVVVKSKMTNVIARDNFAYDYASAVSALKQSDFIFVDGTATTTVVHPLGEEADGNSYLILDWSAASTGAAVKDAFLRDDAAKTALANAKGEVYFTFKFKKIKSSDSSVNDTVSLAVNGSTTGSKNVAQVGYQNNYLLIGAIEKGKNQKSYCTASTYKGDGTDDWYTSIVKYDVATAKATVSADGGKTYSTAGDTGLSANEAINNFRIYPPNSSNQGKVWIDDFVIYTESFDNLTDDDIKAYIEAETSLDSITSENAGAITGNLNLSDCNGMVEWTTSDANVIAADGTVTRADTIYKSAVLTATYTVGEDKVTKKYNFAVAPADTSMTTETTMPVNGLVDDFEAGTAGGAVSIRQAGTGENYKTFSGWAKKSGDNTPIPVITYVLDADKGMVGKIADSADESASMVSLFSGTEPAPQRFATGFDVKLDNGESLTFEIRNAYVNHKLVITNNSIKVGVDDGEQEFAFAPDASGWIRIDIDSNWIARSQNVYVNGAALTTLPLKNMIYTAANNTDSEKPTGHLQNPIRLFDFTVSDGAEVLIDNIAATVYSTSAIIRTDAAIKAAQLFYSGNEVEAKTLEDKGPAMQSGNVDISGSFADQGGSNLRATLTWSGDAVGENNAFNPTTPGSYTLKVTAAYSNTNITESATITVKGAPVVMKVKDGKVSAVGNTTGGVLLIAEYAASGVLDNVQVVEDSFTDIQLPENYKLFFFNSMKTLVPIAFSK